MNEELDRRYLEWLYEMVGDQAKGVRHYRLLSHLLSWEFVMLVPNDDNRCSDGIALRHEFRRCDREISPPTHWLNMGCSVLEMMIGIARHLQFEMNGEVYEWFWLLIDNLGLTRHDDRRYNEMTVDQIIERMVWRQYSYDGKGGLFPLKRPHNDQRKVELWFQMESYMLEMS